MAPPYHHPRARRILELPVYRCTEEQYYRDQNARYEAEAQSLEQFMRRMPDIDDPEAFKNHWFTRQENPWDFNQVVAWIRLYARTDGIGASLFLIPYKRMPKDIGRGRRRGFKWDSNNFLDMWVSDNHSSTDIFEEIRELLVTTARQRFKGWYIDMGVLDVLGPHLNWVALTRDFQPRPTSSSSDEDFP
jgi:hypothetical protein